MGELTKGITTVDREEVQAIILGHSNIKRVRRQVPTTGGQVEKVTREAGEKSKECVTNK